MNIDKRYEMANHKRNKNDKKYEKMFAFVSNQVQITAISQFITSHHLVMP